MLKQFQIRPWELNGNKIYEEDLNYLIRYESFVNYYAEEESGTVADRVRAWKAGHGK